MGPRFLNRGNFGNSGGMGEARGASMGPRFLNRGNCSWLSSLVHFVGASMGPRFLNRGNVGVPDMFLVSDALQWGRGFSTAEMSRPWIRRRRLFGFNGAAVSQPRK